jgi:hypothetical protein
LAQLTVFPIALYLTWQALYFLKVELISEKRVKERGCISLSLSLCIYLAESIITTTAPTFLFSWMVDASDVTSRTWLSQDKTTFAGKFVNLCGPQYRSSRFPLSLSFSFSVSFYPPL